MSISIFELFSIGVGPSSSHTVGPMNAAYDFLLDVDCQSASHILIELYGSLALTGKGHQTDKAIVLGLEGQQARTVDPKLTNKRFQKITDKKQLTLKAQHPIEFDIDRDLIFHKDKTLPKHSNGILFKLFDRDNNLIKQQTYYSIGGGFIVTDENFGQEQTPTPIPYPFNNAKELFTQCKQHNLSVAELMRANEQAFHPEMDITTELLKIVTVMDEAIDAGCNSTETNLPGGLNVRRRAPKHLRHLQQLGKPKSAQEMLSLRWLNLYALAVNEENAAGGRVVTAPTNGAAGIIPAVLRFYKEFNANVSDETVADFLLTAGAIGLLYKQGASLSAAEVGCQGEIGVACSMAAGALTAIRGGNLDQVENAAEIGMEHFLGLTCDPVNGLVQIPCIERNAMGASHALNATRLALMEDEPNIVRLDKVIATMFSTGKDMMTIYKETSLGGLAVNVPEC